MRGKTKHAHGGRIQGGNPPDTWQVHLGKALNQYTDASVLTDATGVYEKNGFSARPDDAPGMQQRPSYGS